MPKHLFATMTWPEVNDAATEGRVVLLPIGAIEQHGRHLPVDVDNVIASGVCERAAARAPELLVSMPPIHYGFNDHNMDFPGTISVKMQHFIDYCFDVVSSLAHQGFRRILLVNGHGSNSALCELVARRGVNETDALCGSINHWQLDWDTIAKNLEGGPRAADHACEWETSEYLHLRPELVQMDKIRDDIAAERGGPDWMYPTLTGQSPVKFMNFWSCISEEGVNGTPSHSSAEKGEAMVEASVRRLIEVAEEFRAFKQPARVDHRVRV